MNQFKVYCRICPGQHLANNALFINIATILWGANISAVKDKAGKLIAIMGSLSVKHPLVPKCNITLRFSKAMAVIAQFKELL